MTYYGATVIHPKTIKPLENRKIPLLVKCFLTPEKKGTIISADADAQPAIPVLVLKQNQILISIYPKDFSFIAEENLSHIFRIFSEYRVKVNMMQNSAVSFSVCADDDEKIKPTLEALSQTFNIYSNENLELLTIRHYTQEAVEKYAGGKNVLLEQKSRHTIQLVLKM